MAPFLFRTPKRKPRPKPAVHGATLSERPSTFPQPGPHPQAPQLPQARIAAFRGVLNFPCANWDGVAFPYPSPSCTYREKALWAGRAASERFEWAFSNDNFSYVDEVDFAAAVFDKAQEIIRYLSRSAAECPFETTDEWMQFTDAVIVRASEIAHDSVAPRIKATAITVLLNLSHIYPFVRAAINAQFEFGTGCADAPPTVAECQFDDMWVARYFPDPEDLPPRPCGMHEVDIDAPGSAIGTSAGWYDHRGNRCATPSPKDRERPIPHDRAWLSDHVFVEYEARVAQQFALYGYRTSGRI